jgi:hypothetical protein
LWDDSSFTKTKPDSAEQKPGRSKTGDEKRKTKNGKRETIALGGRK